MKKMMLLLLSSLVVVLAGGCGKKEEFKPAAIQDGVDRCDVCNMMVADDRHAVQIILKDGKALKFDDLGDLFVWTKEQGMEQVGQRFVRDYHSMEWLKLEEAHYVYDKTFQTPMAFGVYSFKDKASAEKFIEEQGKGKLLSASDLNSHSWERNMDMMKGHGHDKDGHEGHDQDAPDKADHEGHDQDATDKADHEDHDQNAPDKAGHEDHDQDAPNKEGHGNGFEQNDGEGKNNEGDKDEQKEQTDHSAQNDSAKEPELQKDKADDQK